MAAKKQSAPKKGRKKPAEITDEELKVALAKRLPLEKLSELYAKENVKGGTGS